MAHSADSIGRNANRSCTNICGLFVFFVFWCFTFWLLGTAVSTGAPDKILYGTDYTGSVCGHGNPPKGFDPVTNGGQWSEMNVLWYPVVWDSKALEFHLTSALKLGVCLKACPVVTGGTAPPVYTYGGNVPATWTPLFNSTVQIHRCIPDFLSFDCNGDAACNGALGSEHSRMASLLGLGSIMFSTVTELKSFFGPMAVLTVMCIVLAFLWLFALRRLVKPLVVLTCMLLFVLLVVCAIIALHLRSNSSGDTQKLYTVAVVIIFIVIFLYLCLLLFVRESLMTSCDIIEEASKVVVDMPFLVLVPVVCTVIIFCFALFFGFNALMIYSSGKEVSAKITQYANASGTMDTIEFVGQNWRTIGQLYNLFMFLWTMGFIHAISYAIVAFGAVQWYWSMPGDNKEPPPDAIRWSIGTLFRYHLGTLAFGSFLIAIIEWLRVVIRLFEKQLQKYAGNREAAKCLICCAECCLACFERLIKFLTRHAYVMMCLTGDGLIDGAKHAVALLMSQMKVLGINIIAEFVITIGKILITVVVTIIGWLWLKHLAERQSSVNGESNYFAVLVILALLAYFISSVFASVFSVCIDAVLLCFCFDLEENNNGERPHYFPSDLAKHVHKAHGKEGLPDYGSGAKKPLMEKTV